jgi:cell division protein FtsA
MRPLHPRRAGVVAALDIGTSKIACLIGRLRPLGEDAHLRGRTHSVELIGFGHTRARGIKAGTVIDMARAEEAIRLAVDAAERSAKVEIASVALSVSGARLGSDSFAASVRLPGPSVEEGDIGRALDAASLHSVRDHPAALASEASGQRGYVNGHALASEASGQRGYVNGHAPGTRPEPGKESSIVRAGRFRGADAARGVLHSLPVGYALDGIAGIRDPRGMLGEVLSVDLHVVTADLPALKNLVLCVERCHLTVEALIAAPYASGLAVLASEEIEIGATLLDFGNGTTTAAVFASGDCVHVDGIALGGSHVTMDLARGLSTSPVEAERLKTLHGSVLAGTSDEIDMVTVPAVHRERHETADAVSRSAIVRMIRPRIDEILEVIRDRLQAANMLAAASRRIVLTGGGAQLTGLAELVSRVFGTTTRIGRPLGMTNCSEVSRGPAFAVATGLLVYPQFAGREHFEPRRRHARGEANYVTRVGRWLRESF